MHRTLRLSLVSAALAALSGLATAQAGSSGRVFVVTEVGTSFTSLDLAAPGAGPGDQFTGTGDLFDDRGQKVGTSTFTCITAAEGLNQCAQVYALPGGKITTTGTTHPDSSATPIFDARLAVTGGTGRFVGAVGELRLVQTTTSQATLTFHLTR
jgi:hypothetical protein